MQNAYPLIGLLAWLQFKHFVADYLLQPGWVLRGKGRLREPGGYAHAAIHALGSLPGLLFMDLDAVAIGTLVLSEASLHFLIDHLKALHARRNPVAMTSWAYWAAHGADQFLHHLTYVGMLLFAAGSQAA